MHAIGVRSMEQIPFTDTVIIVQSHTKVSSSGSKAHPSLLMVVQQPTESSVALSASKQRFRYLCPDSQVSIGPFLGHTP